MKGTFMEEIKVYKKQPKILVILSHKALGEPQLRKHILLSLKSMLNTMNDII